MKRLSIAHCNQCPYCLDRTYCNYDEALTLLPDPGGSIPGWCPLPSGEGELLEKAKDLLAKISSSVQAGLVLIGTKDVENGIAGLEQAIAEAENEKY